MVKKYPEKRVKAYAFRQLQKTIEKEKRKEERRIKYINIYHQKIVIRGKSRIVYRTNNGRFAKKSDYIKQQIERKQIPETERGGFYRQIGKTDIYRASIAINGIPILRKYYSATIVQIGKIKDIDMNNLLEELLIKLEKSLHYKRHSWEGWFDYKALEQKQYPKPYFGNEKEGISYEFHKTN